MKNSTEEEELAADFWPAGETLAEWCQETGHTQRWLAQAAGISQKHLSQIVHGKARFSPALAVRFENATGMSAVLLMRLQCDRLVQLAKSAGVPPFPLGAGLVGE